MGKKILIHSLVFSPDGVSTAYLYNDIALSFKEAGYEVSVLTTTPHFNILQEEKNKQPLKKKALGLYYESDFHDIKVKHVYQKKYKRTIRRILGFIYWHLISFFLGLSEKNVDIILSPSPPLTIGFINILLGKIKGAKVIYNVQEIYPDLLIENKGLKSKFIISSLKKLEKFVYNKSDAVTTIDEVFYNTIVDRFKDKSKLSIIPNFVDTEIYHPLDKEKIQIDRTLFPLNNNLKLMYAGNIGMAQDWMPLIDVAEDLRNENIDFFVIGEGVMKEYLMKAKKEKCLEHLHVIPYQPREMMPQLIAYSDIQFIFMAPEVEGHGFPSKVYTIMACAKPLLICSGKSTPIVKFLKNKDCSYIVSEKDKEKKKNLIIETLRHASDVDLEQKGKNGYRFIEKEYSKERVTRKYIDLADTLLK